MKLALALIFVAILAVDCFPKKPGGREANKGPRKPCGGEDNLEECECEDGSIYDNKEDLKENCGRHSDNKIVSCTCTDGETWSPPEMGGKHGGGRGGGRGKGKKPCGGEDNLGECECKDGSTYDNKEDLKENCGKHSDNKIVSCTCNDGETWAPPEMGRGKGRKPCGGEDNLEECECKDGSFYDNKEDLKENCGKHSDNKIVSCTCTDGENWSPPAKGGKHGRGRGKGRGKGKKGRACGEPDNIEECECKDGSTYDNIEDIKENCPKRSSNDIVSCTCKDGESWSPPVKDGKHGRGGGKGKEKPCVEKGNVQECTCEDGETYESKKDLKDNCKHDNPISSCECKDGTTWEPTEDEEDDYDEEDDDDDEEYDDDDEENEERFSEFK